MSKQDLMQILEKVYQNRGFDFRQYKESSLERRIDRRLRAARVDSYQQYVKVLDTDPDEYRNLIDDLTIKVTEFFRDFEAWQVIQQNVLPKIIEQKIREENEENEPVLRIWSAGCAAGQEAYSVAILLDKLLGGRKDNLQVDICGTDIDKDSLLKAQQGEYKPDMEKGIPEHILNKYFDLSDNFRAKYSTQKTVHFEFHNLVLQEPLKEMDLILCRNVAIYFERSLQEKIFMDFYNGLNEAGYLFLGKAETLVGPAQERFKVIDKRWKIYQKGGIN